MVANFHMLSLFLFCVDKDTPTWRSLSICKWQWQSWNLCPGRQSSSVAVIQQVKLDIMAVRIMRSLLLCSILLLNSFTFLPEVFYSNT